MSKQHKSKSLKKGKSSTEKGKSKTSFNGGGSNFYSINFASKCLGFAGEDMPASKKAPPLQASPEEDFSKVNTEYASGSSGGSKSSKSTSSGKSWSNSGTGQCGSASGSPSAAPPAVAAAATGATAQPPSPSPVETTKQALTSAASKQHQQQQTLTRALGSKTLGTVSTEYVSGSNAISDRSQQKDSSGNKTVSSWSAKPKSNKLSSTHLKKSVITSSTPNSNQSKKYSER